MEEYLLKEINELNFIHTSWRDYALIMLNSTTDPLRSIWREKVCTSIIHASFGYNIICENSLAGLEIMSSLPEWFTKKICDDAWSFDSWSKSIRISGSKKMKVKLGHYPQETISNEALLCIQYILNNFDQYSYLLFKNNLLKNIWEFSQKSGGKCLYPDEVLTYNLERNLDIKKNLNWITACDDIFTNGIPSDKFKKYYFSDKIQGYPLQTNPDINIQKENFLNVCGKILKEDMLGQPSWKRICICILKNDVTFKYAGFSRTYKERLAREQALQTFNKKFNNNGNNKINNLT